MSVEITTPVDATVLTPVTPSVTAPVTPQTIPVATPAAATPAVPDRSTWVPPHRLREQSETYEARLAAERSTTARQLEDLNQKIQILTGVVNPENPQIGEVRQQFGNVFPGLAKLEAQAAKIEEMLARRGEVEDLPNHYWGSYNRSAMDRLYKAAEATYGQPLSEDAKSQLGSSFVGFLQSNPEAYERYKNDPSIVDEYWKGFTDRFIDPARRTATVNAAGRVATNLPQDNPSGGVRTNAPDVKPDNIDDRVKQAFASYSALANKV